MSQQSNTKGELLENTLVTDIFKASAIEVDNIFTSFSQLYEIYTQSISSLKDDSLERTTSIDQHRLENTHMAFEQMANTVKKKGNEISSQLHTQGIVLLVGNAESILRGMFSVLVLDNFRKLQINKGPSIGFSLQDIISAKNDEELGSLLLDKLEENGNPTEKLNFQNMKQIQGILRGYFGINIADQYLIEPHKYTQIRHIIVHSQSYIDQKFIDNLMAAGIPTENYVVGKKVSITRNDYQDCLAHLVLLFEQIDNEIMRLGLNHIIV